MSKGKDKMGSITSFIIQDCPVAADISLTPSTMSTLIRPPANEESLSQLGSRFLIGRGIATRAQLPWYSAMGFRPAVYSI